MIDESTGTFFSLPLDLDLGRAVQANEKYLKPFTVGEHWHRL